MWYGSHFVSSPGDSVLVRSHSINPTAYAGAPYTSTCFLLVRCGSEFEVRPASAYITTKPVMVRTLGTHCRMATTCWEQCILGRPFRPGVCQMRGTAQFEPRSVAPQAF